MADAEDALRRRNAVAEYRKKLLQHKELESRVRSVRENLRASKKEFNKTEDDLKSLQSVGQIIGEVLRPLDNERLIVKASSGPRYVVGCRSKVDKEKLTSGTRVVLDMTTLTIMRALPREVDPVVYNMLHEDPGNVSYSAVGGLSDQIRELRESIELPLMNPELFLRVGIKPPKSLTSISVNLYFRQLGFHSHNITRATPFRFGVRLTDLTLSSFFRFRSATAMADAEDALRRRNAVAEYRKKLLQHKELESRVRSVRENLRASKKEFNKTEDDLKSLQSVGQIIGEVLRPLDNERLIVKASSGPRYVVGCRSKVDKEKLTSGTRVVLDMTTLTIMRALPREVDPVVYNMLHEDPGNVSYSAVGGLSDQIRELRESIELPLMNPELFLRVGIKPPKGVLLYGPPGTGKTLLARAIASNIDANFLKVVSSAIIDKYIGESARLIREMFGYARDHQPCIIFMDEIDAIGGRRFSEGTSADREIQRTLMELLNQLDGFDQLGKVKMIMATNRPDVLDPALLRPGRLDRKIEIPLPNEQSRMEILKIHAAGIAKHGEIDYEAVVKLAEGFNGADLRNVCTEAGMSAIRAERDYVIHEDFMKAVRKLNEAKKLESSAHYNADFGKD
ncbi:26S proteasome regulatory subunit T4 [Vigna unguiculata]|nr:26S proteasome regulatory subunit T4 [Vigna unguiculata]